MLDRQFVEPRIPVRQLEQGPPFEAPVEVRLFGPDLAILRRLGEDIRRRVSNLPEVVAVRSDLSEVLRQLTFRVDEAVAECAGTTPFEISRQLATTLEGDRGGNVLWNNEALPVLVRVGGGYRGDSGMIQGLDVMLDANAGVNPMMTPSASLAGVSLLPRTA